MLSWHEIYCQGIRYKLNNQNSPTRQGGSLQLSLLSSPFLPFPLLLTGLTLLNPSPSSPNTSNAPPPPRTDNSTSAAAAILPSHKSPTHTRTAPDTSPPAKTPALYPSQLPAHGSRNGNRNRIRRRHQHQHLRHNPRLAEIHPPIQTQRRTRRDRGHEWCVSNEKHSLQSPSPTRSFDLAIALLIFRGGIFGRRMRPSLRRDDRVAAIRQQDRPRAASTRECRVARGDQGHPCLDAEVLYAGAVEGGEGARARERSTAGHRGRGRLRGGEVQDGDV